MANINEYNQMIYEITSDNKIFNHSPNPSFSKNIDCPKFTLGFQHFFHQSKLKLDILKQFENKKKIYLVMNEFETIIDDYENSISNVSNKYFDIKKPLIGSSFYKLWEIYFLFDIIQLDDNDFVTVLLDDTNIDLLRTVMLYREKFGKKNKNNKYINTIINEDYVKKDKNIAKVEYPVENNIGKNKANLIITNGFKETLTNLVMEEQDSYKLILNQILYAIKNQANKGTFICKIYETFTNVMSKIISCLTNFYDKVYIVKPLMSNHMNSEKYIVCINFERNSNTPKYIEKLEQIIESVDKNKNKNLVDIFPEYILNAHFKNSLVLANIKISNKQFININEIVTFINKQNYRGNEYDIKRQMQIDATLYWLEQFFPDHKEYVTKKKQLSELCNKIIKNNNVLVIDLESKL
jgi:hypothetical protein